MKYFFMLGLLLSAAGSAEAVTNAQFFIGNQQAMITLVPSTAGGASDADSRLLLQSMNVPLQNSPTGPGKGLYSQDRIFNLACGTYNDGIHCTVVIQASAQSQLDSRRKIIRYNTQGPDADQLRQLFFLDANEQFQFFTSDRRLQIHAKPGQFSLLYNQSGF